MTNVPTPPVSREARERVVQLLSHHFANDGITVDELERRLDLAYKAPTLVELDQLVADVPAARSESASSVVPMRATGVALESPTIERISAVLSHTDRRGGMLVPPRLEVTAFMGNAELDLSDAQFAPGITEIHISAIMSNVEITLPYGVRVEKRGSAFLSSFETRGGNVGTGEVVVRLTGFAFMSNVTC